MEALTLILERPEAVGIILLALAGFIGTIFKLWMSGSVKQETLEVLLRAIDDAGEAKAEPVISKVKLTRSGATRPAQKLLDKTTSKVLAKKKKDLKEL